MEDFSKRQFLIISRVYQTMCVGVLLYGVVAYWVIYSSATSQIETSTNGVKYLFFFVSMGAVIAIPWVRSKMLDFGNEEAPADDVIVERLYKAYMFSFGMCEIPAFLGMVGAIMFKNISFFFILLVITYAGFYHYRPQWHLWQAYFDRSLAAE